jgi:hypothetical protein
MRDPTVIHPLAEPNQLSGQIKFLHSDGQAHTFTSVVNKLTGDRLTYADDAPPSVNDSVGWVRRTFRNIRAKAQVLSVVGDF